MSTSIGKTLSHENPRGRLVALRRVPSKWGRFLPHQRADEDGDTSKHSLQSSTYGHAGPSKQEWVRFSHPLRDTVGVGSSFFVSTKLKTASCPPRDRSSSSSST